MTQARVQLLPEAVDDLKALDGSARKIVVQGLKKLRTDPQLRGEPLGSKSSGNLTSWRKLVVGNRTYRIVYRVHENGTVVVVWVIGNRSDSEVYDEAKSRLVAFNESSEKKAALQQLIDLAWGY